MLHRLFWRELKARKEMAKTQAIPRGSRCRETKNPQREHTNWDAITPLAASFTLETHSQWYRRMSSPLTTTALDNWTSKYQHQHHAAACFDKCPSPALPVACYFGPRNKEAVPKQAHSQPGGPLPATVFQKSSVTSNQVSQQAGDDESRSVLLVRRHDGEVVLGNTRLRVLTSPTRHQWT
jgi:hypothetical protein